MIHHLIDLFADEDETLTPDQRATHAISVLTSHNIGVMFSSLKISKTERVIICEIASNKIDMCSGNGATVLEAMRDCWNLLKEGIGSEN